MAGRSHAWGEAAGMMPRPPVHGAPRRPGPASGPVPAAAPGLSPSRKDLHHKVQTALRELEEIKSSSFKTLESEPLARPSYSADGRRSRHLSTPGPQAQPPSTPGAGSSRMSLIAMQDVMKRLYQRNSDLQKEIKTLREVGSRASTPASSSHPAAASPSVAVDSAAQVPSQGTPASAAGGSAASVASMDLASPASALSAAAASPRPESAADKKEASHGRAQLLLLLSQRDAIISKLRAQSDTLQAKLGEAEAAKHAHFAKVESEQERKLVHGPPRIPGLDVFAAQFEQLRQDYAFRLTDRLARLKLSSKLPQQVLFMITELQRHLINEASQRQVERMMLNSRLLSLENELADRTAEKKILEARLQELRTELARRDDNEKRLLIQLSSLHERLHEKKS